MLYGVLGSIREKQAYCCHAAAILPACTCSLSQKYASVTVTFLAGVKLVLPAILMGVDDSAWRTKQGSIELLGTMAYLAPKQLSTSLPTVVPILGKTLSDPHPKVQASAKKALEEVCHSLMITCRHKHTC